MTWQSIIFNK